MRAKRPFMGKAKPGNFDIKRVFKSFLAKTLFFLPFSFRALIYQFWVECQIQVSVDNDDIISVSDLLLSWDIVNPQVSSSNTFEYYSCGR